MTRMSNLGHHIYETYSSPLIESCTKSLDRMTRNMGIIIFLKIIIKTHKSDQDTSPKCCSKYGSL